MTKQINLPPSARTQKSRSPLRDWMVAFVAFLIGMAIVAIVVGSLLWLTIWIWSSALSMM